MEFHNFSALTFRKLFSIEIWKIIPSIHIHLFGWVVYHVQLKIFDKIEENNLRNPFFFCSTGRQLSHKMLQYRNVYLRHH